MRLVYTWTWTEEQGRPNGWKTMVTISFADYRKDQMKLTLRQTGFESVSARDEHQQGWDSTLDRLVELLAS